MSRSLWFLFCIYLFVIQALLLGILTSNPLFFKLGVVNAAILLLVALISSLLGKGEEHNKSKEVLSPSSEKKTERIPERMLERKIEVVHPSPARKVKVRKTGQRVVAIITLFIGAILMVIIGEVIGKWAPLAASIVAFLLYVLIGKILDIRGFSAVRKLATAWIYYLVMLASLAYAFSALPSFLGQGFPRDTTVDPLHTPQT